jgi:hypothetical protein
LSRIQIYSVMFADKNFLALDFASINSLLKSKKIHWPKEWTRAVFSRLGIISTSVTICQGATVGGRWTIPVHIRLPKSSNVVPG